MLVGRDGERDHVERSLGQASSGRSTALVVRGEAGIGKSALLDHAVATAGDMRVLRGVGIESEAELAFGALHLLLYPYLDRLDLLPGPQAAALRGAFGLGSDTATTPFLIGAATLTLLAELAAEQPLLCVVDDAQWLDRGSSDALLFAARRFQADPVVMLFAVRDTAVPFHTPGIEELRLPGLSPAAAAGLLDRHSPGLTAPMRARVLEEADGNPLALLELGAARLTAQRAGRAEPAHQVGPLPVTRRVQETFRAQIVGLPEACQSILLVAAADRFAGMDTVLRVARAVGADLSDLDAAERAGLISVADGELTFRHPLVRAAAYQYATHHQRIAVHRAFAEALTTPDVLDRRAWHLAAATTEPDETVAAELERTALRAERRGGAMAVSAAYDRAGRLSVDPELKARRIAKAALAAYDAGKPDRAARLAVEVASLTTDPGTIADVTLLRGQIEYERTSPEADAALACEAARLVMDSDPERAVVMLTEMTCTGRDAGALPLIAEGGRLLAGLRLRPESRQRASADAQISWGDLLSGRPENAVGPLRAALERGREPGEDLIRRVVAGFSGLMLAEDQTTIAVMEMMLAEVRASGALTWIPYTQEVLALAQALRGDFLTAQTCLAEAVALSTEFGMDMEVAVLRATSVWLAAVTGDEPRCRALAAEVLPVLEWTARRRHRGDVLGPGPARPRRGPVSRGVRRAVRRVHGTGQVRLPHPRGRGPGGGGGPRRPPRPRRRPVHGVRTVGRARGQPDRDRVAAALPGDARGLGGALPGGARPARRARWPIRPGQNAVAVRRMVAPQTPPRRGTIRTGRRPGRFHSAGSVDVGGARDERTHRAR